MYFLEVFGKLEFRFEFSVKNYVFQHGTKFWHFLKSVQNLDLQLLFLTSLFFTGVGAFCVELQHLQIQGCHFLKSALNLVLIADSESTQKLVQTRTGIIDLGAFCVELWPSQVSYRISVPMSYIYKHNHKHKS